MQLQLSSIHDTAPEQWKSRLAGLLQFLREYGERRLTYQGCKVLSRLTPLQLSRPGFSLVVATVRGQSGHQLAGISFVADYGKEACLVAVHPLYRSKHIGTKLLAAQLRHLGQLQCSVASDNYSSLKMCFNAGLAAVSLSTGPTGKPTLLLQSLQPAGSSAISPQEGELLCLSPS